MPRNVRNAWIDVDIDGRKSRMSGGPRNKEGGLHASFKVRDKGNVAQALAVRMWVPRDNPDTICIEVTDCLGNTVHRVSHAR